MMTRIHPEAPASGNSAPDSSQSGIRNRFTIPWKACEESMGQAMAKPSAVRENETRNTTTATKSTGNASRRWKARRSPLQPRSQKLPRQPQARHDAEEDKKSFQLSAISLCRTACTLDRAETEAFPLLHVSPHPT